MKDILVRALGANQEWQGIAVEVTEALKTAIEKRHYDRQTATLIGKMLLVGAMMASGLKGDEMLSVSVRDFAGKVSLTASANAKIHVKASSPSAHEVPDSGEATLTLIKDMGLKEPYSSTIMMDLSDFGGAVNSFFAQSEQIVAKTELYVDFDEEGNLTRAFGYMIQALPFASIETKERVFSSFALMMKAEALAFRDITMEGIIEKIFQNTDYEIVAKKDVDWHCECSKEKAENALRLCGETELRSLIAEGKTMHVDCSFCGNTYYFTVEDLFEILRSMKVNQA